MMNPLVMTLQKFNGAFDLKWELAEHFWKALSSCKGCGCGIVACPPVDLAAPNGDQQK
jgi:hypothetical protein